MWGLGSGEWHQQIQPSGQTQQSWVHWPALFFPSHFICIWKRWHPVKRIEPWEDPGAILQCDRMPITPSPRQALCRWVFFFFWNPTVSIMLPDLFVHTKWNGRNCRHIMTRDHLHTSVRCLNYGAKIINPVAKGSIPLSPCGLELEVILLSVWRPLPLVFSSCIWRDII